MRVWHYDEVDGDWSPVDLAGVSKDSTPNAVYEAMSNSFDLTPEQAKDDYTEITGHMGSVSFMTGRFGVSKLWATVWGPGAPEVVNYWRDEFVKAQGDSPVDNEINAGFFSNEIEFVQSLWYAVTEIAKSKAAK